MPDIDVFKHLEWLQSLTLKAAALICLFSGMVSVAANLFLPTAVRFAVEIPFGLIFIGCVTFMIFTVGDRAHLKYYKFPILGDDEKEVLRAYIDQNKMTIPFVVADARPKSLVYERILLKSPVDTAKIERGFVYYTIPLWVFRYFKKNRMLIAQ